ncbi:phage major capsid protein [Thermobispora bispora]|uniref:phage major capsid protein n=1 Tax=Thermobispora bispora TaxID=2006 RepID=UPI00197DDA64|nr:phage major capsid protein [Thermobispora bispora]QSI49945.1 phage major capsid protein [Thermobispora bispora]
MTATATASRARLRDLTAQLEQKARQIDNFFKNGLRDETGNGSFVVSKEDHQRYLDLVAEANEIKSLIDAERKALGIFEYLEGSDEQSVAGAITAAGGRPQYKSLGQAFIESDAYQAMKAGNYREIRGVATFDQGLFSFEAKDIFTMSGGTHTTPAFGRGHDVGISERQRRPNRVRDLFPSERTDANILYGIRQTGFTNNAAPTPERTASDGGPATGGPTDVFGRLPKSNLQFTPYTAPIVEIGHYVQIHKNTLADESRLRGIIDRDLIDGVKLVEDEQILFGDGVGENILGITQTPGIQLYTGLATDKPTAQIRRAITRALLAHYDPNGIVIHPLDFEQIELEEDGSGAYRVAVSVAIGAEKRIWRLNVVDTPAMQEGKYLIGSFGYGAKLYDREVVTVQASTEHATGFTDGYVTIKASERIGLAVDRPESFVFGTFTEYAGS